MIGARQLRADRRADGVVALHFVRDSGGRVTGFESRDEGGTRRVPRVARILYLHAMIGKPPRCILMHLTTDGLITDFDVVVH